MSRTKGVTFCFVYQLKAFNDAFETIYGDNEVSCIQVQQLSEEFQSNCVHFKNMFEIKKSKIIIINYSYILPLNSN
jgi:hypothetical protein